MVPDTVYSVLLLLGLTVINGEPAKAPAAK